jgi:hypothetical protein
VAEVSEFTPRAESDINVSLANLNERVSERATEYLSYLEEEQGADIISNLQDALVDMIAVATVAYTALDKLTGLSGDDE